MLSIENINKRINEEFCKETFDDLSDETLLETYLKQKSVIKKVEKFKKILEQIGCNEKQIRKFFKLSLDDMIAPGLKGNIRGNLFNKIMKNNIEELDLDGEIFLIEFEKKHPSVETGETPDWYIENLETGKIIIGMNQLDFWRGGQQILRGQKYLIDNRINTKNVKFLSVVCNKPNSFKKGSKIYNFLNTGYQKNTLTFPKGLEKIIFDFFDI